MPDPHITTTLITEVVEKFTDELIEIRRDLHAHPELSWSETRTTDVVAERLADAGLDVRRPSGGGLLVDIGTAGPRIALRADLDALPVDDLSGEPWASTVPGVAHACGHDVHTAGLVGAGLALAELHDRGHLPGRARLVFQPAEEVMPGGAMMMREAGALDEVSRIFALHCDPTLDVGTVGLRDGALTGAADQIEIVLHGRGGHTSRPHLTEDLTFALGKLVTELPAIVSRRLDPRAGISIVWGHIQAGSAPNVIPMTGVVAGTVRMLDALAWGQAENLIRSSIASVLSPYGVEADVRYHRGVPPVVNDATSTAILSRAVATALGEDARVPTTQSLGGEDFAWYVTDVPGSMGRLGTRRPGGPTYDLHQGDLSVDERAVPLASRVLAGAAVESMVTAR